MKRALLRRFALLFAFAIAFAQIAVAAQPWPLDVAAHRQSPAAVDVPEPCSGHLAADHARPAERAPSPNYCEVHCQDATQPDATIVAIAAPVADAWLAVSLTPAVRELPTPANALAAKSASPPARLLYARFLN